MYVYTYPDIQIYIVKYNSVIMIQFENCFPSASAKTNTVHIYYEDLFLSQHINNGSFNKKNENYKYLAIFINKKGFLRIRNGTETQSDK